MEDIYFNAVLLCLAKRIHVLTDFVYYYRIRKGSIMTSLTLSSIFDRASIHRLLMTFKKQMLSPADYSWFEEYCFRRLLYCYTLFPHSYGEPEFKRFVRSNGFYVWRHWLAINRGASLKKKIGRLFFFRMPGLRQRLLTGMFAR